MLNLQSWAYRFFHPTRPHPLPPCYQTNTDNPTNVLPGRMARLSSTRGWRSGRSLTARSPLVTPPTYHQHNYTLIKFHTHTHTLPSPLAPSYPSFPLLSLSSASLPPLLFHAVIHALFRSLALTPTPGRIARDGLRPCPTKSCPCTGRSQVPRRDQRQGRHTGPSRTPPTRRAGRIYPAPSAGECPRPGRHPRSPCADGARFGRGFLRTLPRCVSSA